MLFESYSRKGILKRLDADFDAACGSAAHFPSMRRCNRIRCSWILALGGWMSLIAAPLATAQSVVPAPAARRPTETKTERPPVRHSVHHHHHAKPSDAVAPVAPPRPLPPAEQPPKPAVIEFNHGILSVRAQNSSLVSILTEIQHRTGLTIEGLNRDQRIYGQYGPGSISATLSALLDGSGYDFVIIGGGSGHAATRLILSAPGSPGVPPTTTPAVANNQQEPPAQGEPPAAENQDQNEDQSQPADPTAPPEPKSPQEIFNEMRRMNPQ